jgi:Alpha amylase, catalytic domain
LVGWTICFGAATSTNRQTNTRALVPDAIGSHCVRHIIIALRCPRSFQDVDGIGDLRGIEQRRSYLVELVDAIWLSPIFPSPMSDFGYDISDYTDIDPLFGSLDYFDALLAAAHSQGLKVIFDLVPQPHLQSSALASWPPSQSCSGCFTSGYSFSERTGAHKPHPDSAR